MGGEREKREKGGKGEAPATAERLRCPAGPYTPPSAGEGMRTTAIPSMTAWRTTEAAGRGPSGSSSSSADGSCPPCLATRPSLGCRSCTLCGYCRCSRTAAPRGGGIRHPGCTGGGTGNASARGRRSKGHQGGPGVWHPPCVCMSASPTAADGRGGMQSCAEASIAKRQGQQWRDAQ